MLFLTGHVFGSCFVETSSFFQFIGLAVDCTLLDRGSRVAESSYFPCFSWRKKILSLRNVLSYNFCLCASKRLELDFIPNFCFVVSLNIWYVLSSKIFWLNCCLFDASIPISNYVFHHLVWETILWFQLMAEYLKCLTLQWIEDSKTYQVK